VPELVREVGVDLDEVFRAARVDPQEHARLTESSSEYLGV
jgi:hypothetical protein